MEFAVTQGNEQGTEYSILFIAQQHLYLYRTLSSQNEDLEQYAFVIEIMCTTKHIIMVGPLFIGVARRCNGHSLGRMGLTQES